jgi:polysaccharide pyruvyl transferase WcaK-like protein
LFVGDTNGSDDAVVQEVLADLRAYRPDLDPACADVEPVSTFSELMRAMAPVGTVVATRYHNVICALRLCKPTISIGYAPKNAALMADMGLSEYCQSINSLDMDRLVAQFTQLETRATQLKQTIAECNAMKEQLLKHQFAELSALLFSVHRSTRTSA